MTAAENPMHDWRVRLRLAVRLLRDPRTLHVPPGHPYSPIPSVAEVDRAVATAEAAPESIPGVDLDESGQWALLEQLLPLYADLPFGTDPGPNRFGYGNTYFTYADAVCYALLLRHLRPRRVIEVGAGHSSALALDIDERFLGGATDFTFVDPDPRRLRSLVRPGDLDGRLVEGVAQDVRLRVFEQLGSGDVLLIDSSHNLKAGSDVQYLLGEVLPRLASGVHIGIHDVFHPFEYPPAWLRSGFFPDEAYAVRCLLQYSDAYRVVLFSTFLAARDRDRLAALMPLMVAGTFPTGSIWLRRTDRR